MKMYYVIVIFCLIGFVFSPQQIYSQQSRAGQEEGKTEFPIYFSLKDSSILSPVRSQPTGGCWASSAMITIESAWRKENAGDFVLSDKNLQLFHGFSENRNTFGNHYMATAYFSRWSGPVIRSPESDTTKAFVTDLPYRLTEARYLSSDPKIIKKTILEFGPVYSMMYFSTKTGLDTIRNIYYSKEAKINHAVVLCGWNDTLKTLSGEGVWIAQNSLGVKFADGGFFYIPYQDKNFLQYNSIWPQWEANNTDAKLYFYDTLGSFSSYGFDDSVCYGLVKYTAEFDGKLTKAASFVDEPNTTIKFTVFEKFNEKTSELTGNVGSTTEYFCSDAGYYTIEFFNEIPLKQGQDFFIMASYSTPAGDTIPLPYEAYIKDYSNPHIQTGKCWINPDFKKWPTTWYPCGTDSPFPVLNFDLCIRAYVIKQEK